MTNLYEYTPFKTKSGKTVVNENCSCGALKTEHDQRFNHESSKGHGACAKTGCQQFTWTGFVFAEETK